MHPFQFGSSKNPIFGMYHAPTTSKPSAAGVVICQPLGHEYIRAHRTLRNLAVRLSASGLHVLRFDYFGCGDSAGDGRDGSLDQWRENIGEAIDELKDMSGVARVSLVGVRFGATLAVLAGTGRNDLDAEVLWDPVAQGSRYVEELLEIQRQWLSTRPPVRLPPGRVAEPELIGFPLTPTLKQEFGAVDLFKLGKWPGRRLHVILSGGVRSTELSDHISARHAQVSVESFEESCKWDSPGDVHRAVLASSIVEGIVRCFEIKRAA
jgi:pimeloyl-ACP methyl ester carboxylesterase